MKIHSAQLIEFFEHHDLIAAIKLYRAIHPEFTLFEAKESVYKLYNLYRETAALNTMTRGL